MKKILSYVLVILLISAPVFNLVAIQEPIVIPPKKSYLASLKTRFDAAMERFKKALTIEDVETQRIVVKELFGILRLIMIALGIAALIKYGVPFLGKEVDVRGKAIAEGMDVRVKALTEAIDSRIKTIMDATDVRIAKIVQETDVRVAKINEETTKKIKEITEGVDVRVQGVTEAIDSRIKTIMDAADSRIAKLNEEADKKVKAVTEGSIELIQKLKKEFHETGLVGPMGASFMIIAPPSIKPVLKETQESKESKESKEETAESKKSEEFGFGYYYGR